MKNSTKIFSAVLLGLSLVACSSANKMAQQASKVTVECEPAVLEVVGGVVDAFVTVTYPANYFNPKAILEVTPVVVFDGGEKAGTPLMYQGEKVKDNYKVVPAKGRVVSERIRIPYVEGMEKSYLELRGVASVGVKSVNLPSKKVADGCNTTYMLVKKDGVISLKADGYQEVIKETEEGQILYTVNSANVRSSELKSQSIKDFQAALDEIKANERKTLTGTEVVAYASPEGGERRNAKLSDDRSRTAGQAWDKVTKGHEVADPEVRSIGQDWEGFRDLVQKSNIEDKDLILRVLSMYSDPAVRESEIRNMSEVFKELKGGVLPELRRARFIANVEYKNFTSEELMTLIDENIDFLDESALLRAATLVKDTNKKLNIYRQAIDKFDSDRARFNTGVTYLAAGDVAKAENAFNKVKTQDGDLQNAKGVIALRNGDIVEAARLFNAAGTEDAKLNIGIVNILTGNYDKAASELADAPGCPRNAVLAYILTDQLDKAEARATCKDPKVYYLKAIIAARKGNAEGVRENLEIACQDPELKARAEKDVEFAAFK